MIEVKNLTKIYGNHVVVDHLSFTIESGKIYGFLGPNGAGKTTTMNMMTGCLASTEGQVSINGHDILEEPVEAKRAIGYLPEIPPLYPDMTPAEYLTFVAAAKGVPAAEVGRQVEDVMEKTHITPMRNRLIRNLSKGYKQRVGISQALLGNPELIILDEPTVGLDPKQILEIRDLILTLGETHTVIISSHILSEISAICDHVMILRRGHLVASDTLENIRRGYVQENKLLLTARGTEAGIEAILSSMPGVIGYELTRDAEQNDLFDVSVTVMGETDLREAVFKAFAASDMTLLRLTDAALSLEEVFLRLTEDVPEEAEAEEEAPADASAEENEGDGDNADSDDDVDTASEEDGDDYKPLFGAGSGKDDDQ